MKHMSPIPVARKRNNEITMMPVNAIQVGRRCRKDMGDIDSLAISITDIGLLHPIVVTPNGTLIAGERRLRACKRLGWLKVPIHIVNLDEIVRGEVAENVIRKDFLPTEIDAIRRAYEPIEKPAARGRMLSGTPCGNFPQGSAGKTRDKIGAFAGVSGRTVQKIAAVVEAAKADPEAFSHLVEQMDNSGKVDRAYRELRVIQARNSYRPEAGCKVDHLLALAETGKRFNVIYADPPWDFYVYSGKSRQRSAERRYDTCSLEEIKALPVAALASEDCALFLWCVMPELPGALEVVRAWGFAYKTVAFNWVKTTQTAETVKVESGEGLHWGMGHWTRNNAELCLLATKGAPTRLARNVHQVIVAPVGEHSEKPGEVRRRIKRLLAGPYLELYGRRLAPDWTVWGNEIAPDTIDPACHTVEWETKSSGRKMRAFGHPLKGSCAPKIPPSINRLKGHHRQIGELSCTKAHTQSNQ